MKILMCALFNFVFSSFFLWKHTQILFPNFFLSVFVDSVVFFPCRTIDEIIKVNRTRNFVNIFIITSVCMCFWWSGLYIMYDRANIEGKTTAHHRYCYYRATSSLTLQHRTFAYKPREKKVPHSSLKLSIIVYTLPIFNFQLIEFCIELGMWKNCVALISVLIPYKSCFHSNHIRSKIYNKVCAPRLGWNWWQ